MSIDLKEMGAVAAWRTGTYAILGALYSAPPSSDVAEAIREGGLDENGRGAFSTAAHDLAAFFRNGTPANDELVAEHTRLFVLPSGIIPHESFYRDEKKRLGGHVTVNVKKFYEKAGAEIAETCLELPDHMGVELEFMKFLCDLEEQFWAEPHPEGLKTSLDFQNRFLASHLLNWHEALCDRVLEETGSELYRALARLTKEFLEAERRFVPLLTEQVHSRWRTPCALEA